MIEYEGIMYRSGMLMTTGTTVRIDINAPRLKGSKALPLVVVPSAKMQIGFQSYPSSSINLYRSLI